MKLMKTLALTLPLCLALIACTRLEAAKQPAQTDKVTYKGLSIQLKEGASLRPHVQNIVNQVNSEQGVSFALLTDEFMETHAPAAQFLQVDKSIRHLKGKSLIPDLLNNIKKLNLDYNSSFFDLKKRVEKDIEEKAQRPILCNRDVLSLFDVYGLAKMQCYSGTSLHTVIWRQGGLKIYNQHNPVIIYEEGHILPGFMKKEGENFRLIGVETTLAGAGKKDYGLTKDLDQAIRVMNAHHFILLEIVKDNIKNESEIVEKSLQQTANTYNIPLQKLEEKIAALSTKNKGNTSQRGEKSFILNSTPAGFGSVDVPPGDQKREKVEEVSFTHSGAHIPSTPIEKLNEKVSLPDLNEVFQQLTESLMSKVIQISAGGDHYCQLHENKKAICWGDNSYNQLDDTHKSLEGITQVSAGGFHTCALTEEKKVICWGNNSYNQLDDIHKSLEGITQVSAGIYHTCALTEEKKVICWGNNSYNQLDDIHTSLEGITQVSAGGNHTCALTEEKKVICWGNDAYTRLGNFYTILEGVVQVSAGKLHTCALTEGKEVICWGDNSHNQLNDVHQSLEKVTQISAGIYHTCALTEEKKVICWGNGTSNRLNDYFAPPLDGIFQISAGGLLTCTLSQAQSKEAVINCPRNKGKLELL